MPGTPRMFLIGFPSLAESLKNLTQRRNGATKNKKREARKRNAPIAG